MFDYDKWTEIFNSIRRHKLRTFLTALSVWWGIFMLIILLGAGTGLENSFERDFADDATNSLWIYSGNTSIPYKGLPTGRFIGFTNADFEMLSEEISKIDHATGRYHLSGDIILSYQQKSLAYPVRGVHPDHQVLENTKMVKGRYINDKDILEARKVCIIGDVVKKALFGEDVDIVGEEVTIGGISYTIIGHYTDDRENETRMVYLPISTCQKIFSGTDRVHQFMVTYGDANFRESRKIEEEVINKLAVVHKFDPQDEQAVRIWNEMEGYREFKTVMGFIKGFIWFVGIGSIIAGVIGVSNIMLIIVKDRTKEIGVRKAMGATPGSIISMILQESIFITAVSGYLGLLAGFALIYGLNSLMVANDVEIEFFYNPEVNFGVVMIALIILVISGALAGLIPAMKAAKINPVQAMKG